jgi:nicotinamide mononucleotide transporter
MSWIEIAGVAFALASVVLTVRQHIACWPTGIVNALLFMVMFWGAKLYADVVLQLVYVVLSIYGWWYWLSPTDTGHVPITRVRPVEAGALALVWALVTVTWGTALSRYTDAALPYWDSCTVAMSLVAQWLLSRKILENWIVWITADVLMVGIYYAKELYLTSALYLLFTGLATAGLVQWWRKTR